MGCGGICKNTCVDSQGNFLITQFLTGIDPYIMRAVWQCGLERVFKRQSLIWKSNSFIESRMPTSMECTMEVREFWIWMWRGRKSTNNFGILRWCDWEWSLFHIVYWSNAANSWKRNTILHPTNSIALWKLRLSLNFPWQLCFETLRSIIFLWVFCPKRCITLWRTWLEWKRIITGSTQI